MNGVYFYSSYRCELIPENDNCTEILLGKYYAPNAVDTSILNLIRQTNILASIADHKACTLFFNGILCFYNYPPCDTSTSELLPLCAERCWEVYQLFELCSKLINFIIINFNCTVAETYYGIVPPHVKVSTTSCSKF